jgi:hypothetical protein
MGLASIGVIRSISHILAALFNKRSQFERAWREYKPEPGANGIIEGRWVGQWRSEISQHSGELKCLLSRVHPGQLDAKFLAAFRRIFRVGYGVSLEAEESGNGFRLKGKSDLGTLAGGVYLYEGQVTRDEFRCNYRSEQDHGVFTLKRLD